MNAKRKSKEHFIVTYTTEKLNYLQLKIYLHCLMFIL